MRELVLAAGLLAVACGGCGGHYILTAPDHVAAAGEEAPVVVRLQRNDFFVLAPAVRNAAMRLKIGQQPMRAAFTDKLGYAGAAVPAPSEPGRHELSVKHLDKEGDEVRGSGAVWVIDPATVAVAVDLDALPTRGDDAEAAAAALTKLAEDRALLYFTREDADEQEDLHEELAEEGYPQGPILMWRRKRWHIVREAWWKPPKIEVESRLVSQLGEIRKMLPNLRYGLTDSSLASEAFAAAGLTCVMIGDDQAACEDAVRRENWGALQQQGLPE
jgi:hypothetical protein